MGVNLVERYAGYQPPSWVRPTVERLLASLPEGYLSSLGSVTLTDRHSTGKGKTRRVAGRKYDRRACLGFYRRSDRGSASIEVLVDNTLAGLSSSVLLLPFVRDWALGRTLYHEIGHHLERRVGATAPGGEAAAEDWAKRLIRAHLARRYPWLRPVAALVRPILRALRPRQRLRTT